MAKCFLTIGNGQCPLSSVLSGELLRYCAVWLWGLHVHFGASVSPLADCELPFLLPTAPPPSQMVLSLFFQLFTVVIKLYFLMRLINVNTVLAILFFIVN